MSVRDRVRRLRQPAYTGENRCLPCTAVNVAIALGLAGAVATVSPPVGAIAFAAFLAVISLRGYLVPGTPTLTRRYLPERVLERFGKGDRDDRRPTIESGDLAAVAERLETAGVVGQRSRGAGVKLTPSFRERLRDRLSRDGNATGTADGPTEPETDAADRARASATAVTAADVRTLLDADEVDRRGEAAYERDGRGLCRWESEAALAVDVAADRELRDRLEGWGALDVDDRRDVLTGLRLLLERCPACGGRVESRREHLEHCCRRPTVGLESTCEACDRSLAAVTASPSSPLLEWVPESGRADASGHDGAHGSRA